MLGEWAQAIQDAVNERDELRRQLVTLRAAKMVEEQVIRDQQRENAMLKTQLEQLREEVAQAIAAYNYASIELNACRARIRFLEKIAHDTGHIVQCKTGGTQ